MRKITIHSSPIPFTFNLLVWVFVLNLFDFGLNWLKFMDNLQMNLLDTMIYVSLFYTVLFLVFLYSWSQEKYTIDEVKISVTRGIFFRKNISVNIDDIETMDIEMGVFNRLFGYGNVTIKTGGGREATIRNITNPQEIHSMIDLIRQK